MCIRDRGYIVDELCGCKFRISSKSFYQINPVQTEVLYGKAVELAGQMCIRDRIMTFPGCGLIGFLIAKLFMMLFHG